MYAFQPRVPFDHIMAFVQLVRSDERNFAQALQLVGAITGELGSLLGANFAVQGDVLEVPETLDGCM